MCGQSLWMKFYSRLNWPTKFLLLVVLCAIIALMEKNCVVDVDVSKRRKYKHNTHSVCMDGACERVKHTCIRTWNNKIFSTLTAPLYMATQIGNRVNKQWYFFYTLNLTTHTRSASSVAYENCIHSLVCLLQTLRSHTYFVRHSTMLVVIVFRFHQFSACVFLLSFAFVFAVCFCFCFVRTPTIHNWMTSVRIMHGIMTICCLKLHRWSINILEMEMSVS